MLSKLIQFSRVALIPAIVLYGLGFIVTSAEYSRLGFQLADLLNARFFIAGIYVMVSLYLALQLALALHTRMPPNLVMKPIQGGWVTRTKLLSSVFSLAYAYSFVAHGLLSVPGFFSTKREAFPIISFYLKADPVDDLIAKISTSSGTGFAFRIFLYLTWHFLQIYALVKLVQGLLALVRTANRVISRSCLSSPSERGSGADQAKPEILVDVSRELLANTNSASQSEAVPAKRNVWQGARHFATAGTSGREVGTIANLILAAAALALAGWAFFDIAVRSVSSQNVVLADGVDQNIFMAWLLVASAGFYAFLVNFRSGNSGETKQLSFFSTEEILDPRTVLQHLVIPILGSVYAFGIFIYPRVPYELGGGQVRRVTIETKRPLSVNLTGKTLFLVGENKEYLYLIVPDEKSPICLELNRDEVILIKATKLVK